MSKLIVSGREKFLNRILNADPGRVLNSPETLSGKIQTGNPLDQEIKKALNQIKSESISADGRMVDYK